MTQMGQEDPFPPPSLNGGCRLVKRLRGDGRQGGGCADSRRSPDDHRMAQVDPQPTFMIPPPGDVLCRKAGDQVPCDQAVIFPEKWIGRLLFARSGRE
jgi:hypothetical protein